MTAAEVRELQVGRAPGSLNTDTMMLVHLPADGSRATLISLPRDSYVNIPGYGMNKLNAAYAFGYNDTKGSLDQKRAGGVSLLIRTIKALTGAPIDHYVLVSLLGFVRISDAIGNVPINLCQQRRRHRRVQPQLSASPAGRASTCRRGHTRSTVCRRSNSSASATICPAPTSVVRLASATS